MWRARYTLARVPRHFTPPGQAGPVLDPVRWFLHGRETAPSDAHPWLSGDEELRNCRQDHCLRYAICSASCNARVRHRHAIAWAERRLAYGRGERWHLDCDKLARQDESVYCDVPLYQRCVEALCSMCTPL